MSSLGSVPSFLRRVREDRFGIHSILLLTAALLATTAPAFAQAIPLRLEAGEYKLSTRVGTPQELSDEEAKAEADRLLQQGIEQAKTGQFRAALQSWEQALQLYRKLGDRQGEANSLGNLGLAYDSLGQYNKAIDFHQQSLAIKRELGDRRGEANSLGNLGLAYSSLGQYDKAIDFYQQSLTIDREIGDRQGQSSSLGNLGLAYDSLGQYNKAIDFYQQSLTIAREIGDRRGEANALGNLGVAYDSLRQYDKAIAFYQQSLSIAREIGDRGSEGTTLSNVGKLLEKQNQPELAIVFLKQSVNVREQIKKDNRALSTDLQQSYSDTIEDTYRRLAGLLLEQGKLLEAQQVLELLKIQEVRDHTRGTVTNLASGQIQLSPEEQTVGNSLNDLITFAAKLSECERQTPSCPERPALLDQVDVLTQRYNRITSEFEADATQARRDQDKNTPDPKSLLSEDVSRIVNAQPGTALIYPVVLQDKLWILWASQAGLASAIEVPVERTKVDETVLKFRQLMTQCEDPGACDSDSAIREIQAVSQQLNQWLMPADLETALRQAKITNLVFALDYTLRYIPMSALYDGQQYLIEKNFTVSTVTSAWFNRVNNPLPADTSGIKILGLGLTNPVTLNLPEGEFRFGALNNVQPELSAIIQPDGSPASGQGIYPGQTLLNGDFDADAFHQTLGRQILHIATHGKFMPVSTEASFLVLGNQQPWRISEINNNRRYFTDLSLVVLSACETALGGSQLSFSGNKLPDGREISGISQTFLDAGVDTVIASLWLVNDPATRDLMQQFYSNLSQSRPSQRITISQALRDAQLSLLRGTARDGTAATRADLIPGSVAAIPNPDRPATTRYAHPYYWSAFTIIGNGL